MLLYFHEGRAFMALSYTVLGHFQLGSEEIISDVEVEASGVFHFFQRLYELKVDELRRRFLGSGLEVVPCPEE